MFTFTLFVLAVIGTAILMHRSNDPGWSGKWV
jgi:hypothetical protein